MYSAVLSSRYGLLSDCVPIGGQRRKPYFVIGWMVFVLSYLILAAMRTPHIHAVVYLVSTKSE